MGSTEHIHRVQLDETDSVNNVAEVTDINPPGRAIAGETLGGKGISPGLTAADLSHRTATLTGVASSDL